MPVPGTPRRARSRARAALAIAVAATALTPALASAAAGDLDPSFGTGGKKTLAGTEQPLDVFVQPDGRIVEVGGQSVSSSGFLVRRLNPDGSPDKSFDGNGAAVAKFPLATGDADAAGSALLPDGSIVVAGNAGSQGVAVARFRPDGSLDPAFAEGGTDGDGWIVIATLNGFQVSDVVITPSGKIALTGWQGNDTDFAVIRLRSDGTPDGTTFDDGDFEDQSDTAYTAAGAPDGTVTLAGTTSTASGYIGGVVRYKADGKLDETLAGTGRAKIPSIGQPTAAVVQPDGKTLVAGATAEEPYKAVIVRLTHSGEIDKTFGNEGTTEISDEDLSDGATSIALLPDGKIVVGGSTSATAENATYDLWVTRLDADGHPDPAFGSGGRALFSIGDVALGGPVAVQPDGKVVMAGYGVAASLLPHPVLARLLPDPVPTPDPQPEPQPDPKPNGPAPDTTAPQLTGLKLVTKGRAREVRFKLSEQARVRFAVQRTPRHGRPKTVSGSFSVPAAAGKNRIDVTRRGIVRRLRSGRYRLVATPTDASGNQGVATRAVFKVAVKPKKK